MKKQRKQYAAEEKVAILRRHLLEKEPVSKLCDEVGLQPTVFYRWQKEFFENGAAAFEQKARPNHSAEQERIAYLEKKIQTKDLVAEASAEVDYFGGRIRGSPLPTLWGHPTISPPSVKWADATPPSGSAVHRPQLAYIHLGK